LKKKRKIEREESFSFSPPAFSLSLSFLVFSSQPATMDAYEKLEKIGEGTYGKVGVQRGGEGRKEEGEGE
jgi:hypothetical protein